MQIDMLVELSVRYSYLSAVEEQWAGACSNYLFVGELVLAISLHVLV